jgi:large conductance mechanosensitive channel
MFNEFKTFIMRGNVMDLAVGIVIGAAFTTVINSFVNDILMPPIGLLLGKVDFANLFVSLNRQPFPSVAAAKAAGAPTLNYGMFINNVINFLIIAFSIFVVVRQLNRLKKEDATAAAAAAPPEPAVRDGHPRAARRCPHCTSDLSAAR